MIAVKILTNILEKTIFFQKLVLFLPQVKSKTFKRVCPNRN